MTRTRVSGKRILIALCSLLNLLPGTAAGAQTVGIPGDGPTVDRIEVNVVNVEVFVTDKRGRPIVGLGRDDFQILVDGAEIPISNFYVEEGGSETTSPSPDSSEEVRSSRDEPSEAGRLASADSVQQRLRLLVFVDETALQPLNRKRSFKHLRRFLEEGLDAEDEIAVVSLAPGLRFRTEFSRDRKVVGDVLKQMEKSPALDQGTAMQRRRALGETADSYVPTNAGPSNSSGSLALIRAVASSEYAIRKSGVRALAALVDTLGGIPGRKAILHVSDGISARPGEDLFIAWQNRFGEEDRDYQTEIGPYDLIRDFGDLAARANASDVTFYALDADPPTYSYGRSAEYQGDAGGFGTFSTGVVSTHEANKRATLELAASETGGQRIVANGRLPSQFKRIERDFKSFYSLGFSSPPSFAGEPHEVKVRVPGLKGIRVRHRTEFSELSPNRLAASQTMAALLYGISRGDLGVRARSGLPEHREDGTTLLPLEIEIPFDQLALLPDGETRAATLSLFVTVQDKTGATRPVQRIAVRLRLPEEKVAHSKGRMARHTLPLILKPDDRRVALGVRDDVAGVVDTLRLEIGGANDEGI